MFRLSDFEDFLGCESISGCDVLVYTRKEGYFFLSAKAFTEAGKGLEVIAYRKH